MYILFFFKQKTAYEMRISDWSSYVCSSDLPKFEDGRKPKRNPLNDNFHKGAFQELWGRINRKAVYRVEFDTAELIQKCIGALNRELRVTKLQYSVQTGIQLDQVTDEQLRDGTGFSVTRNEHVKAASARSPVKYDPLDIGRAHV